jgi:Skp family chaperone for outer membrane proteins
MSSNRPIAAFAFSLLTATCLAAGAHAETAAAAATSAPKDTSVVVKNAPAAPSGNKSCEDLKAAIDGKLKAKGVKVFTLDIVPAADVKTEKVVGSCEAGAKKIIYKRG